jgi:poly(3-hydroxybutyrate) depolymerase
MSGRRPPILALTRLIGTAGAVILAAGIAAPLGGCGSEPGGAGDTLPRLGLQADGITVSGISAGGYMAMHLHLAHAERISGAAILAAGPWHCAEGQLRQALGRCISADGEGLDVAGLTAQARAAASAGKIAPLQALAGDRVWVFRGTRDSIISAPVAQAAADFYRAVAPAAAVTLVDDIDAVHAWPTLQFGAPCEGFEAPYLAACGYDAAGALLEALVGKLAPARHDAGRLLRFDQQAFWPSGTAHSLHAAAWLFVPAQCEGEAAANCRLHVVFHGCRQSEDFVEEAFVRHTGLNEWAAGNDLVVLYPQVRASALRPLNPQGCWDWWGYSGADYDVRGAAQVSAVAAMIEHLTAAP